MLDLEEAMAMVPDELWYNEIVYHVKRCDIAWKASAAFQMITLTQAAAGILNFSRQELISQVTFSVQSVHQIH